MFLSSTPVYELAVKASGTPPQESCSKYCDRLGQEQAYSGEYNPREKSWIMTRTIVSSLRGKHAKLQSMLNDEGTIIVMCEYIDKAIESMYSI